METTLDILAKVIRELFEDPDICVTRATTANDVDGWDSLSNVLLMRNIELAFNLSFTSQEILKFKNLGDIEDCINAKDHASRG